MGERKRGGPIGDGGKRLGAAGGQPPALPIDEASLRAEVRADSAVRAYLQVSPTIVLGHVPIRQLEAWRADVLGGQITNERKFHAAWMSAELGHAVAYERNRDNRVFVPQPDVASHFDTAIEEFNQIADNKRAPRLLRLKARLASSGLQVDKLFMTTRNWERINQARREYAEEQNEIAVDTLMYVRDSKGSHDDRFLQALTVLTILNYGKFIVTLTPSRFWDSEVDTERQQHLFLNGFENSAFGVRVAQDGPSDIFRLDPDDLLQGVIPTKHGYGTLQTFIDLLKYQRLTQNIEKVEKGTRRFHEMTSEINKLKERAPALSGHVDAVRTRLTSALKSQMTPEVRSVRDEVIFTTPQEALSWYQTLSPYDQFETFFPILRKAIAVVTKAYNKGLLTPPQIFTFAWMNAEAGMYYIEGEGMGNGPEESPNRRFDQAGTLFGSAVEAAIKDNNVGLMYQIQIDQAALPLYRALVLKDRTLGQQTNKYCKALATIGTNIMETYRQVANTDPSLSRDLEKLMKDIALKLLVTSEEEGYRTHVAASSTLRQSDGWETTIWVATTDALWFEEADEFKKDYFGRVSLPNENEEKYTFPLTDLLTIDVLSDVIALVKEKAQPEAADPHIIAALNDNLEPTREAIKRYIDNQLETEN